MSLIIKITALFSIIFSLSTMLSEITLFTKLNFSVFGMLIESCNSILLFHLLTVIPLIFLFISCLFGLFNLKLSGIYGMYKNNHTDSVSLLFISGFMCRIGFPLCINFVQILKLKNKTILEDIVGSTELDPIFGAKFFYIYPAFLLILVIFNLFDFYNHIIRLLGYNNDGFNSRYADEKALDGRMIFNKSKL